MTRALRATAALAALVAGGPEGAEGKFLSVNSPVMPAKPVQELREKIYPPAHLFAKSAVPAHSKFLQTPDGVFELESNRALRINLGGKGQKRWAEIATSRGAKHERFTFKNGAIRMEANPTVCLGPEGGVLEQGVRVRAQPCESGADHQQFLLTREARIRSRNKHLCMTVKDSPQLGAEVVIGPCSGDAGLFVHRNNMIQAKKRTDLHFNIQGGGADAPIVMWKAGPSMNEAFEFAESGQLRLKSRPGVCLVAQQGVSQGSEIIGRACTEGEPGPNELFGYDNFLNVVYAIENPDLVFNAKGGAMRHGDHLVLWPVRQPRRARQTASGGVQEL